MQKPEVRRIPWYIYLIIIGVILAFYLFGGEVTALPAQLFGLIKGLLLHR